MDLTIFTPTYNRAHTLPRVYKSLCEQKLQNFEWLVIDDGSSDRTESLIKTYLAKGRIEIRYIKITNGGKYKAINRAVPLAKGYLFMILDSDDYLAGSEVTTVISEYRSFLEQHSDFCAIVGHKIFSDTEIIGGPVDYQVLDTDFISYREKLKIKGDKAEVIKTEILKEFPFPELPQEKFCPEGLIWNRMSLRYKARYINTPFMICEYRADGLSAGVRKCREQSPRMFMLYYSEYCSLKAVSIFHKLKRSIIYWACFFKTTGHVGYAYMIRHYWVTLPLGWLFNKLKRL